MRLKDTDANRGLKKTGSLLEKGFESGRPAARKPQSLRVSRLTPRVGSGDSSRTRRHKMNARASSFEVPSALDGRDGRSVQPSGRKPDDLAEQAGLGEVAPVIHGLRFSTAIVETLERRGERPPSEVTTGQSFDGMPEPVSSLLTAILVNSCACVRFLSSQPDRHPNAILCAERVLRDARGLAAQLKAIPAHLWISAEQK
jgi:hypothetical protein